MTPEEQLQQIQLMGNIFVKKDELDQVLDRHADRVVKQLEPKLENIEKELKNGHQNFKAQDRRIKKIELRNARADTKHDHPIPTRTPETSYIISSERIHKDDEIITEDGIKKKTAAIVAVVTGVIIVAGLIVVGIIALVGELSI